jgi:hypothetical protein
MQRVESYTVAETPPHAQQVPNAATPQRRQRARAHRADQVLDLHVRHRSERHHRVHERQIPQRLRVEEQRLEALLRAHCAQRRRLDALVVVSKREEFVETVVAGLGGGKEEAGLEDADRGAHGNRVEVLDLEL